MNSLTPYTFSPQESNDSTLILFGTCDKWTGHVHTTNGERKLHGEGQISHYNREIPSILATSGQSEKRRKKN
jgi:hypothetical protein